mgnify:CR=1 FL=1
MKILSELICHRLKSVHEILKLLVALSQTIEIVLQFRDLSVFIRDRSPKHTDSLRFIFLCCFRMRFLRYDLAGIGIDSPEVFPL